MQDFRKNLFCTVCNVGRVALLIGIASICSLAPSANAQIAPDFPNPTAAPNPLTTTQSLFRSNMQVKIMNAAEAMPESKYSYRPTKDVRSYGELLTHIADISYYLCANMKGVAVPGTAVAKGTKAEIMAYVKSSFSYCDDAFSGFTDAHLNDPADFWGFKTNKMFILTQVGNHDALHYGNLVTYLRLNDGVPSGGWW
ncbi:DinB family protein [Acidicapsa dinghuensis]|uniref:DinB family protein n=1 Tax=Acidicapsa dinghuensis TaxID=2218256 RepID=A0ABW1EGU9_9BACT|nr:DinB family protein [Acidicapsa dinghuensis]